MKIIRKEKRVFKTGEKYHLDQVYMIMGLFPLDGESPYYYQDDIGDLAFDSPTHDKKGDENDCGEYVKYFAISL